MGNSDPYSQVELSADETEAALAEARQKKYYRLAEEEKQLRRKQQEEELRRPWVASELFDYLNYRAVNEFGFSELTGDGRPIFEVDDTNLYIIQALCYYFTDNKKFEEMGDGWKLEKGLCLMGNVGLGKSLLMTLLSRNKRQCFDVISCRKISALYAELGHDTLYRFSDTRSEASNNPMTFYQKKIGICFDDLGTEETKKHYGNQVNVMAEIILNRYDRQHEFGWHFTHVTTNLTADQIEEFYGTRVRSRFREMFNAIKLTGNDRRK